MLHHIRIIKKNVTDLPINLEMYDAVIHVDSIAAF